MSNHVIRSRKCLKCDRMFLSRGPGNRICQRCKRSQVDPGEQYRNGGGPPDEMVITTAERKGVR